MLENGLKLGASPALGVEVAVGDGTRDRFVLGPALTLGAWSHLAVTWSAPDVTVYVDGLPVAADALPGLAWGVHDQYVGGMLDRTYGLGGRVDELQLFDRALSDAEVLALFG